MPEEDVGFSGLARRLRMNKPLQQRLVHEVMKKWLGAQPERFPHWKEIEEDLLAAWDSALARFEQPDPDAWRRARFAVELIEVPAPFVLVHDLGGGKSVTNDAEYVVQELAIGGIDLKKYRVIYRDSCGQWDGLLVYDGRSFAGFAALGASSAEEAVAQFMRYGH